LEIEDWRLEIDDWRLKIEDWRLEAKVDAEVLKKRTKDFALWVLRLCQALPKTYMGDAIGKQLLRSATSVAANYRAACRARSQAEFSAKLQIVILLPYRSP
jgi:predicted secreted hydrolase